MKALVLLPSGLSALPQPGPTPLEVARTPALDRLAREGRLGRVRVLPGTLRIGSDLGTLAILGYDPRRETVSRGALEAQGMGVVLEPDDLALRMNLVSTFRGVLVDATAGGIRCLEARLLVESLQTELGGGRYSFHAGLGYRNLLVVHGGRDLDLVTVPPYEAIDRELERGRPRGADAEALVWLLAAAREVLAGHDVNRVRTDLAEPAADAIWCWGEGPHPVVEPFALRTGLSLGVVAAVPLIRGLGEAARGEVPYVPGATGGPDTPYERKLELALTLLARHDVVLLHVGAVQEASRWGDSRRCAQVLEDLDHRLVGPLLTALRRRGDTRLLVATDHPSRIEPGRTPAEPLPFVAWGPGIQGRRSAPFTERAAAESDLCIDDGYMMMAYLLGTGRTTLRAPGAAETNR